MASARAKIASSRHDHRPKRESTSPKPWFNTAANDFDRPLIKAADSPADLNNPAAWDLNMRNDSPGFLQRQRAGDLHEPDEPEPTDVRCGLTFDGITRDHEVSRARARCDVEPLSRA
jgi:hypothetical protein